MSELFSLLCRILLPMALAGGVLYLLLLALRPLWGRLGAKIRKGALLAVCLLLLVPLTQLATLLFVVVPPGTETVKAAPLAPLYRVGEAIDEVTPLTPSTTFYTAKGDWTVRQPEAPAPAGPDWSDVLTHTLPWVYFAGLAATITVFALRRRRLARRLRSGRKAASDTLMEEVYRPLCAEMGLRRPPALYRCAFIPGPLLAGVLRPAIYLPLEMEEGAALRLALRHELTHYRQGDLPLKLLVLAATAVQWFLPLGPLLRYDFDEVCEEVCDAAVAAGLSGEERQAYAGMLLDFAGGGLAGGAIALSARAGRLKKRLDRLLHPARPRRSVRAVTVVALCLLVAAGMLTGCSMMAGMAGMGREPARTLDGEALTPWYQAYEDALQGRFDDPNDIMVDVDGDGISDFSLEDGPFVWNRTLPHFADIHSDYAALAHPVPGAGQDGRPFTDDDFAAACRDTGYAELFAETGTPIYAVADGVVCQSGYEANWGSYIWLAHSPYTGTVYAHCDELLVSVGDTVSKGQQIATVGSSGYTGESKCSFRFRAFLSPNPEYAVADTAAFDAYMSYPNPIPDAQYCMSGLGEGHDGVDVMAPPGSAINAPVQAKVVDAGFEESLGYYLRLEEPMSGLSILFAHCGELLAAEGELVEQGQRIATVGATGYVAGEPFCHIEVRTSGGEILEPRSCLNLPIF